MSRNNSTEPRTETRLIHLVSRSYRGCRAILDQSTRYRAAVEIAIKKAEEARQTARYRGGVELAFKTSFSRCEKHRHECNSTNNPINIFSSQNHLSITILNTWIFKKKHTHTLNKSNQFYISKISQDNLVSIH